MHSWEILHFTEFSITCVLLSLPLFCLETNHELPIKLFGCSIVLHCVLHIGLQYWSIMHSCEISHFTTVCCTLCRSIVLCCVLYVGCNIGALCIPGKYCILLLCVACLASVLYCTECCMLTCSIVLHTTIERTKTTRITMQDGNLLESSHELPKNISAI